MRAVKDSPADSLLKRNEQAWTEHLIGSSKGGSRATLSDRKVFYSSCLRHIMSDRRRRYRSCLRKGWEDSKAGSVRKTIWRSRRQPEPPPGIRRPCLKKRLSVHFLLWCAATPRGSLELGTGLRGDYEAQARCLGCSITLTRVKPMRDQNSPMLLSRQGVSSLVVPFRAMSHAPLGQESPLPTSALFYLVVVLL